MRLCRPVGTSDSAGSDAAFLDAFEASSPL